MLLNSFIFLPGIGEKREHALWRDGIRTWSDYARVEHGSIPGVPEHRHRHHAQMLDDAWSALEMDDATHFGPLLGTREAWRALDHFLDDALFLDIETTGLGKGDDHTTVCGMHMPNKGTALLVHGDDLDAGAVAEWYDAARCLVTFNGTQFDIPFLREDLDVEPPTIPHVDLRFALARVDVTGGLKRIEQQFGLSRPGEIDGMDGYMAVKLWQRHLRGDTTALPKLVEYNRQDVENMVPLARIAYDLLKEELHDKVLAGEPVEA